MGAAESSIEAGAEATASAPEAAVATTPQTALAMRPVAPLKGQGKGEGGTPGIVGLNEVGLDVDAPVQPTASE